MRYWQAFGDFFRELRRDFRRTGAVLPSSRFLAKALVRYLRRPCLALRPPSDGARILEVGAGTGAITSEILKHLKLDDRLDVVEINGRFVTVLQRRFLNEPHFQRRRSQVRLLHSAVEDLPGRGCYDYIVSCLPLNNFPAGQVRRIFQVYQRLLAPDGILTFYEYVWIRHLKRPFVGPRERRRLYRVGRIVSSYVRDYQFRRQNVFANIPPATVRHLNLKPQPHPVLA